MIGNSKQKCFNGENLIRHLPLKTFRFLHSLMEFKIRNASTYNIKLKHTWARLPLPGGAVPYEGACKGSKSDFAKKKELVKDTLYETNDH